MILGGILAVVVVLIFLRNVRSTLVSAVALPTAIIGTFAVMQALGFTFNIVTMLALTLSIGLLIDDAIVVIENIVRHLEHGESPEVAAEKGTERDRAGRAGGDARGGGGLRPGGLHEGADGALLLPVRGHRRGGGAHLLLRLDDAHAHALGAPAERARRPGRRVAGHREGAAGRRGHLPPGARLAARPPRDHRRRGRAGAGLHGLPGHQAQVHLPAPAGHERGEGHAGDAGRHHAGRDPAAARRPLPAAARGGGRHRGLLGGRRRRARGGQQGGHHRQLRPHRRAALRPVRAEGAPAQGPAGRARRRSSPSRTSTPWPAAAAARRWSSSTCAAPTPRRCSPRWRRPASP